MAEQIHLRVIACNLSLIHPIQCQFEPNKGRSSRSSFARVRLPDSQSSNASAYLTTLPLSLPYNAIKLERNRFAMFAQRLFIPFVDWAFLLARSEKGHKRVNPILL